MMYKKIRLLGLVWLIMISLAKAQTINSPYSRYGLGDVVPSQNILSRGMGGISAAYWDPITINFLNPASYSRLVRTSLDIGLEVDNRTLRAVDPPRKFNAYNPNISYVQFAFPVKRNGGWGVNLGIRPITRINYKIEELSFKPGPDSIHSLYEGNGGAYEVHAGTGVTLFKNFSIGINAGYLFGSKDFSTKTTILNDTVFHERGNREVKSNYGGLVANAGIQYRAKLGKGFFMRLGAYGNLKQTFSGTRDIIVETFQYSSTGAPGTVDSVYNETDVKGDVVYPASYGAGIILEKDMKWLIGVDYSGTKWADYRYFGESEPVRNTWTMNVGAQLFPTNGKSYWRRVFYRAGFLIGNDYIAINDDELPKWGASVGLGLPMRPPAYSNQFSVINLSLEVGQRGNKQSPIRESYFRIGFGLSLSDIWFLKRKFD